MAYPKDILGKVATRKNLEKAWHHVSTFAKPFSHGMSEQTILDFRANYKKELERIREQLLGHSYQFGSYRAVTIQKKSGKKRPLQIADVRDRVVQRAIASVLEKFLSTQYKLNNPVSYAYIRKKGVQTAVKQMLTHHQDGCKVILEADIKNFFDTVDLDRLLNQMIFPILPDTTINHLIIDTFAMEIGNKDDLPEEDWELYPESSAGLPQGGHLSPLFSNIYLASFDQRMLQCGYKLIRYADDFIVMCKAANEAEDAYKLAVDILENELNLKLHDRDDMNKQSKTRVLSVSKKNPVTFLGICFTGSRLYPDGEKRQKLTYKMSRLQSEKNVRFLLNSANNLLQGWIAAYSFSDINKSYAEKIDTEMNRYLWKTLHKMGWKLKPKNLNTLQREFSGVKPASWYLDNVRRRMDAKTRVLFSKYWSN